MGKLKECPNCGCQGDDLAPRKEMDRATVYCIKCGMEGPTATCLVFAWKLWNRLPRRDKLARHKERVVRAALANRNNLGMTMEFYKITSDYLKAQAKRSCHGKK